MIKIFFSEYIKPYLAADDSHEILCCIIGYYWKSDNIWNCCLLQIIGGALRVKQFSNYIEDTILWQTHIDTHKQTHKDKTLFKDRNTHN